MLLNIHHPANSHHVGRIIASVITADIFDPSWTTALVYDFKNEIKIGELEDNLGVDGVLKQSIK